jgi:hypothetical protein
MKDDVDFGVWTAARDLTSPSGGRSPVRDRSSRDSGNRRLPREIAQLVTEGKRGDRPDIRRRAVRIRAKGAD